MELIEKEADKLISGFEYFINHWVEPGVRETEPITKELFDKISFEEMFMKGSLITSHLDNKITLII